MINYRIAFNKAKGMKMDNDKMIKFNCDCGFSWEKGRSGQHNCSPFYRETIDGQKQKIAELRLTIHRMKHTLEVIASNPGWNDHHCRAMKILEEYSEHNKAKGK